MATNFSIPQWGAVRADLDGTSNAYGQASRAFSEAGNIFGKMRDSALQEQQFNQELALKDRAFNEQMRQFNITSGETARDNQRDFLVSLGNQGLDRDKLLQERADRIATDTGYTPQYSPLGGGNNYSDLINRTATSVGIDPNVLMAVAKQESGFNPNAVSPTGVQGMFQVTIPVMEQYGRKASDRNNPEIQAEVAARNLKDLADKYGNYTDALIAYNGGDGAVQGVRTGTYPQSWREAMIRKGVDPDQKIKEVQGYARMASQFANVPLQRSIAGQEADRATRERDVYNTAMSDAIAGNSKAKEQIAFNNQRIAELNNQLNILPTGLGGISPEKQQLMVQRDKLVAANKQLQPSVLPAQDRQTIVDRMNRELTAQGMGYLAAPSIMKQGDAETEFARQREIAIKTAEAQAKVKQADIDAQTKRDATKAGITAKNKATEKLNEFMEKSSPNTLLNNYRTQLTTAIEQLRAQGFDDRDIQSVFGTYNPEDTKMIADTDLQNDVQEFLDNPDMNSKILRRIILSARNNNRVPQEK